MQHNRTGRCWPAESQSREILIFGSRWIGHRRDGYRHRRNGVGGAVKNNQADRLHILLQGQVFNEADALFERFVAVLITVFYPNSCSIPKLATLPIRDGSLFRENSAGKLGL